jgi:hypothetical protein
METNVFKKPKNEVINDLEMFNYVCSNTPIIEENQDSKRSKGVG